MFRSSHGAPIGKVLASYDMARQVLCQMHHHLQCSLIRSCTLVMLVRHWLDWNWGMWGFGLLFINSAIKPKEVRFSPIHISSKNSSTLDKVSIYRLIQALLQKQSRWDLRSRYRVFTKNQGAGLIAIVRSPIWAVVIEWNLFTLFASTFAGFDAK